jgi:cobalt/nickel transport system permease protein
MDSLGHLPHDALPAATPGNSAAYLRRIDPRLRIVAAAVMAVVVATLQTPAALGTALAAAAVGVALSGVSLKVTARRLVPLELFLVLFLVLLPLTTEGTACWQLGPWAVSREGLSLALAIALKANAIVLATLALAGTLDPLTLGHALSHLRVPGKLTHLLLFTIRYMDVLAVEYRRMRTAMRARCFRPRTSRHAYRAYGYLVGMLLVRSFDRAERIAAAMKCRGFRGRFHVLHHFHAERRRDLPFAVAAAGLMAILLVVERL